MTDFTQQFADSDYRQDYGLDETQKLTEGVSTALVEVTPGAVMVFGEVPDWLGLEKVDLSFTNSSQIADISGQLTGWLGTATTLAGNLGTALQSTQGLYRLSDATVKLLNNGATLAVKDGMNLGTILQNGIVGQARFIPVAGVSAAGVLAAAGPAIALMGIQLQLNKITRLAEKNIELTTQVLRELHQAEWNKLEGVQTVVKEALAEAAVAGYVPESTWDAVNSENAKIRTLRVSFKNKVENHLKAISTEDKRARREYLQHNAEAIIIDTQALLSALNIWIGYKLLQASISQQRGEKAADGTDLAEQIAKRVRDEFEQAYQETRTLTDALRLELRKASLDWGQKIFGIPVGWEHGDRARHLLEALTPIAEALRPSVKLEKPDIVCISGNRNIHLDRYLEILSWRMQDDETLKGIAYSWPQHAMIAITNQRVIAAKESELFGKGEIHAQTPLSEIRYIRSGVSHGHEAVDVITRKNNLHWVFDSEISNQRVKEFVRPLTEAMRIPDSERRQLLELEV